jgi:hypothetical protein
MLLWAGKDAAAISLPILPLPHQPGGLRAAVLRLRRLLRDTRDRQARRSRPWRAVAVAGMAQGDDKVMLLIRHAGIGEAEIVELLRMHWPGAQVTDITRVPPVWNLGIEDAVELARAKRGVEPLRIVVMRQGRDADLDRLMVTARSGTVEPMPALF